MDTNTIVAIIVGVIIVALIARNKKKKGGSSGGGSKGNYAKVVLPAVSKGYMSVARWKGKTYGGTYRLHNHGNSLVTEGKSWNVPVDESVYQIWPDASGPILACEMAKGQIFRLQGNKIVPIWSGGRGDIIWVERFGKNLCAVSTDFNNGGVSFHNITTGAAKSLADRHFHARQIIQYKGAYYILAYNYSNNQGGWWISRDLQSWSWRGVMTNMRPLKAVEHKGLMYLACSPYVNGKRTPPPTIMTWNGTNLKTDFRAPINHAMFFGIASDGDNIWAGTLTNWRGNGNALLYRKDGNSWKPIWKAPDPEITDLVAENGVVWAATRNEASAGNVFEISGTPGLGDMKEDKGGVNYPLITSLGAGALYKPISDSRGVPCLLTPSHMGKTTNIKLMDKNNKVIPMRLEAVGPTNPDRQTYFFHGVAANTLPSPLVIQINNKKYVVPNPQERYG